MENYQWCKKKNQWRHVEVCENRARELEIRVCQKCFFKNELVNRRSGETVKVKKRRLRR